MILVAGGTGTLGTALVRMLTERAAPVRVLTRAELHADHLRDTGVDIVIGDVRIASTLGAAAQGCTTVISAIHGFIGPRGTDPAGIDRDGNRALIRAAVDAGVDHVIFVSAYGATATHPMSLQRMKSAAERSLVDSGLDWTIIRPVPFMETWIDVIGAHLADRNKAVVPGPGTNPINFVSVRDVAATVDRTVQDTTMRNQCFEMVGPESLTLRQIAEQLIASHTEPSRIVHIPLAALRAMSVLAWPLAPGFARQARAAVVMSTTDMTATGHSSPSRAGATRLDQLLPSPVS